MLLLNLGNKSCAGASFGPLCSLCEDGYSMVSQECQKCPPRHLAFLPIAAFLVILMVLYRIITRPDIKKIMREIKARVDISPYLKVVLITYQVIDIDFKNLACH
jgi:hypothetical protein